MLKQASLVLVSVCALLALGRSSVAHVDSDSLKNDHYLLHEACSNVINEQVSWELYASVVYMNMGGYFNRPSVARSGYAKFFKDQSQEEYGHAQKFIDYINSRNGTLKRITIDESPKNDWAGPKEALEDAIKLEKHVYAKLRHIHLVAEQQCQDPHLMDFLEGYFFTEQVDSIRELQEMLSTIDRDDSSASSVIEHLENSRLSKSEL